VREPPVDPVRPLPPPCALEEQAFTGPLSQHRYSAGLIRLFLDGVLRCAASQRATAAFLRLIQSWLPGVEATPCANTGRMWLLRLGLHELTREKERADDWVWIMDHTLQLGPWKCLVIVGVRLNRWRQNPRPLVHEDLVLLNLTPMDEATGDWVYQAMCQTVGETGVPREIVSDGGGELQRGLDLLQKDHPEVARVYDVKHKMALLLKKGLEADPRWETFITQSNQTKRKVTQTELAFLLPPSLKNKARYMNLEALVNWGRHVTRYLDEPGNVSAQGVDRSKLEAKLGWLREYRAALEEWSQLLDVAEVTNHDIRCSGYRPKARQELAATLLPRITSPTAQQMRDAALEFVMQQSEAASGDGERLIGSSEILESLIGKYKQLQSTHSKGGMTAMLLSFGAIVSNKTQTTICDALRRIRTVDVGRWCRKNLGVTLQAQRLLAFERNKNRIQTGKLPE